MEDAQTNFDRLSPQEYVNKISEVIPSSLKRLLGHRDGAVRISQELKTLYPLATFNEATGAEGVLAWQRIGKFYFFLGQFHDTIALMIAFYEHFQQAQIEQNTRLHKGYPFALLSDSFRKLNCPAHSKRYLMLSLVEDAINLSGRINPNLTGSYCRLAWEHGLSDYKIQDYAQKAYKLYSSALAQNSWYPEYFLQELDHDWIAEFPSSEEVSFYHINRIYLTHLLNQLPDSSGKTLEEIGAYLVSCVPGWRSHRRMLSHSTDYDVVCINEGQAPDFRSEIGRYFVCECKDWNKPADFTTFAKFCRVLDSLKSRFGIIFSQKNISGKDTFRFAHLEQVKIFQDRGIVIVVVDENDLKNVQNGQSFLSMIRRKYEEVRLDLKRNNE